MKKTFLKVAALVLAVVISVIAFSACSQTKTTGLTKEYFEQNKVEVLTKSIDYSKLFSGSENPFRVFEKDIASFSVDFTEPDSGIGMSASVNMDKAKATNSIDFAIGAGEQVIDIGAYFDRQKLALYSDALLGEGKAYGITFDSFDNMVAKFDKSAIASLLFGLEEGQVTAVCELYGINQQYIDGIAEACKNFDDLVAVINDTDINAQVYAACEPFYKDIVEETVEINGKQVDALVLEIEYSKEMYKAVYDIIFDMYEEVFAGIKDLYAAFIPEPFKAEMVPEVSNQLDMVLETIKAEYESSFEDMDMSGVIKVFLSKETGLFIMETAVMDMTVDGETVHIDITEYIDQDIRFDGTVTVGEETVDLSGKLAYTGDEDKEKWAIEMDVVSEAVEKVLVDMGFEINKADGTFNLYVNADEADEEAVKFDISGNLSYTADSFEIAIDNITVAEYGYEDQTPVGLKIRFGTKAQVTELGEYTDILELSQEETYALVGQIAMSMNSLSTMFVQPEPDFYDEYYYSDDYDYDYYYDESYDYAYDYDYSGYEY